MRLRRGEIVDWYVEHDESAVLIEDHVLVLSPLATRVLEVVDYWVSIEVVLERLVDHFGEPPAGGADAPARETIDVLAGWGIVVLEASPPPA
jgi:hypothetical protein